MQKTDAGQLLRLKSSGTASLGFQRARWISDEPQVL